MTISYFNLIFVFSILREKTVLFCYQLGAKTMYSCYKFVWDFPEEHFYHFVLSIFYNIIILIKMYSDVYV